MNHENESPEVPAPGGSTASRDADVSAAAEDLIFVGSPGDLEAERRVAEAVISSLARDQHLGSPIRAYCYDQNLDKLTASTGPQEEIQKQLSRARVLVCMFGERLGTPLPRDFVGAPDEMPLNHLEEPVVHGWPPVDQSLNSAVPLTGTVYEFLYGRARKKSVLVYLKGDATVLDRNRPHHERNLGKGAEYERLRERYRMLPDEIEAEYREQKRWLCRFIDEFATRQGRATFHSFENEEDLKRMLNVHLRQALGRLPQEITSPGKGLAFYDRSDAAQFHGRSDDVRSIIDWRREALRARETSNLVIVDGVSGVGKSSFLRAGLAAALAEGRTGLPKHAVCVLRPGDLSLSSDGLSPFRVLGRHLANAVAESHGWTPWTEEDLERWEESRHAGDEIVSRLRRPGAPADSDPPPTMLVLDQFEQVLSEVEGQGGQPDATNRWQPVLGVLRALSTAPTGLSVLSLPDDWRQALLSDARFEPLRETLNLDLGVRRFPIGIPDVARTRSLIEAFFRDRAVTLAKDLSDDIMEQIEGPKGFRSGGTSFLPMLSLVLTRLYEAWRRKVARRPAPGAGNPFAAPDSVRLDRQTFGVDAQIASAVNDLGEQAHAAFLREHSDGLSGDALRSIVRRLVWINSASSLRALRSERETAFTPTQIALLRSLEAVRLAEQRGGQWRFVHDAVVDHWARAKALHEQERVESIVATELNLLAEAWLHNRKRPKYLLDEEWEYSDGLPTPAGVTDVERVYGLWEELRPETKDFVKSSLLLTTAAGGGLDSKGTPRLLWIARSGDATLTEHYLTLFPNTVNARSPETGDTPLLGAAASASAAVVELLLDAGADLDVGNVDGVTSLTRAAGLGLTDIVRFLLRRGALAEHRQEDGTHALDHAAAAGHLDLVRFLLEHAPALRDAPGFQGRSPLMAAATAGQLNVVQFLLDRGADPSVPAANEGRVLALAAHAGHLPVVRRLLEHSPSSLDERGPFGSTALMLAAGQGRLDVVRFLLDKGANPALQADEGHALEQASRLGHIAVVQELLQRFPSLVNVASRYPALISAAWNGRGEVGRLLLGSGADPQVDLEGARAIHLAAQKDHLEFVEILLEHSPASLDDVDREGHTPLMLSAKWGHMDVVRSLVASGADLTKRSKDGKRAIEHALSRGNFAVAQFLLDRSAATTGQSLVDLMRESLSKKERDGETALTQLRWDGDVERLRNLRGWLTDHGVLEGTESPLAQFEPTTNSENEIGIWRTFLGLSCSWEIIQAPEWATPLGALDRFEREHACNRTLTSDRILSARRVCLPCYPDLMLIEALCESVETQRRRVRAFLLNRETGECVATLGGSSSPIHWLNREGWLRLSTASERAHYVRFFCQYVFGNEGPFSIVDEEADLALPVPLGPPFAGAIFLPSLKQAAFTGTFPTFLHAIVHYEDSLFSAAFKLSADGSIEMIDDELLLPHLPGTRRTQADGFFEIRDNAGETPVSWELMLAASLRLKDVVDQLLRSSGPETITARYSDGTHVLWLAVFVNHIEIARRLIEAAPTLVGLPGRKEASILTMAAEMGHEEIVDLLLSPALRERVRLDHRGTDGSHALDEAARGGHLAIVQRLIETDASLIALPGRSDCSVLMAAAREGHTEVVEFLLRPEFRGRVDLRHRTADGAHALDLAAEKGHLPIVRLLLAADQTLLDLPGLDGRSVLSAAKEDVRRELVAAGANELLPTKGGLPTSE